MKKISIAFVLYFLAVTNIWATPIDQNCPQFTAYGSPDAQFAPDTQFLCRKNYAVIHACSVKNPVAVMEYITPTAITGPAKRQDDFREDPEVAPNCRSRLADYQGGQYDRGHMSPAGNNTQTAEIMSESFFLSNMIPQVPNNNRGIWRILESQVRDQIKETGQGLYVISGAIFDPNYTKIGNNVGVPTRLFKIIINKQTGRVTAFLMPNAPLPVADLPKYVTTVQQVEQATGMKFKVTQ